MFSKSVENQYSIIDNEVDKHWTLSDSDSDDSGDLNSSTELFFDILNKRRS